MNLKKILFDRGYVMAKKKITTLLSLDTSTTSTGWAIFKDGIYQESGVIDNFKKEKNGYKRLELMVKELLLDIEQLKPDIIVIEKDVVFGNMKVIDMLMKYESHRHAYENYWSGLWFLFNKWNYLL